MDILCPNCKKPLRRVRAVSDILECQKEHILWHLSEREEGQYLEKISAPEGYRGPTVVKMDKISR